MNKYLSIPVSVILFCLSGTDLFSQFKLPFGDFSPAELSNKPYTPDPGADAIILSDAGIASLNYVNGFYVELERDVRIRIVNSNGFDYANIEIPFTEQDKIYGLRASTFNLHNGEKAETRIDKKSFIYEKTTSTVKTLKFNFPDVHEGSIIEYSYVVRLKGDAIYNLIPWKFQAEIPTVSSNLIISYPEGFLYKNLISGSSDMVNMTSSTGQTFFFGEMVKTTTRGWLAQNIPAFREEPYIKSTKEHLTKLTFELANVDFPGIPFEEITPGYESLTRKLLDRPDFGSALNTPFKSLAEKITAGESNDLAKVKKLHRYLSTNIQWDGIRDYTTSLPPRTVLKNKKGNAADINLMLIAMMRSVNINADPVILSTRSNGSLNQLSAILDQFNYVLAYVHIGDQYWLVDATDPLRPFNVLPFDCLNGKGRLISEYGSKFINLGNSEKLGVTQNLKLSADTTGNLSGKMEIRTSDYNAYSIRNRIRLESEEGYLDLVRSGAPNIRFSLYTLDNVNDPYTDLTERCELSVLNGSQIAGNEIIINPYLSFTRTKNPFISPERKFPVDFGCPSISNYTVSIKIPKGYSVLNMPENISFSLGKEDGKYEFRCKQEGDEVLVSSSFSLDKTIFQPGEYAFLRAFYSKILQKESELLVMRRDAINTSK